MALQVFLVLDADVLPRNRDDFVLGVSSRITVGGGMEGGCPPSGSSLAQWVGTGWWGQRWAQALAYWVAVERPEGAAAMTSGSFWLSGSRMRALSSWLFPSL